MSENGSNARVLIVADDPLVRAGLARMLHEGGNWTEVSQVSAEEDLTEAIEIFAPDLLLWDLGWDPEENLARMLEIGELAPPMIVILADESYAREAWTAGARALFDRDINPTRLHAALLAVLEDLSVFDPRLLPKEWRLPYDDRTPPVEPLTERELDVLRLMAEGFTNRAIAVELEISEFTVKSHVNAILRKLGAQSRTDAAVRAARQGLIPL
jgi:DNA-binding NarL/FixJ family response regulator